MNENKFLFRDSRCVQGIKQFFMNFSLELLSVAFKLSSPD